MQLYHHAFSMNSQKVRLALEEKGMDYISHSLNPLKGKDLNADLFNFNPDGKMPVFKSGNLVLTDALAIVQFLDSMNEPLGGSDVNKEKIKEWMHRIDEWDPKPFTLSHIPLKLRMYFGRFKRRAIIARMARNPSFTSNLRLKLQRAYATDEMMNDSEALEENKRQLERLLDMAEEHLENTGYLAGESFTMADVMLLPVLGWMELLRVDKEYILQRQSVARYWAKMKRRPSYKVVIGQYLGGLNKYKTLFTTSVDVSFRTIFQRY